MKREYEEGPQKETHESLDPGQKSGAKDISGGRDDTNHPVEDKEEEAEQEHGHAN